MAKPTSPGLSNCCETALKKLNINYQTGGTYVVMEGPQFSTLAESNLYRSWGADVIGMTNMPELNWPGKQKLDIALLQW